MLQLPQLPSLPFPLARALAIVGALDPVRLTRVLFDFSSVVGSQFWDGRRTGPDFISPMASLTKRQSGHLARLVLQYCKNLPLEFEQDNGNTPPHLDDCFKMAVAEGALDSLEFDAALHPQAVAILDLDNIPGRSLESQYTTSADVDLMVLVPILLSLLTIARTGEWFPTSGIIAVYFVGALILGPGTLTLVRRTAIHPAELDPGPGCAVLMGDDLTVVILGSQRIVEAITEGGFYLSFKDPTPRMPPKHQNQTLIPVTERWQEKQLMYDILYGTLEGGCRGACEAIAMRLLHLNFSIPYLRQTAFAIVFGRIMSTACWWGYQASTNDTLPPVGGVMPLRLVARVTGELLGLLAAAACFSDSSTTILLFGASFFAQSFYFGLFARLVLQSQNYRVRTERFFEALGHPQIKKWPFHTWASAATFVCLVLCQDISRPVKNIHVSGVMDTLIPNQRDVWKTWKARVADRIVHEERIVFAPTIPTFSDWRQCRLKLLLDEAQSAYDKYCHLPPRCVKGGAMS